MTDEPPHAKRTLEPQGPPPGIYASKYDPLLGAAICRRVADGESLRAICRADVDMPTAKTVWNWRRAHEEFDLMLTHAQGVARTRALAEQAERDEERLRLRAARRIRRAWNEGLRIGKGKTKHAICVRLMTGESLTAICADPALPCIATVYNWLRADPAFVEAYRRARKEQQHTLGEIGLEQAAAGATSLHMLDRRMKAEAARAAFVKLRRYAPPTGPEELLVAWQEEDYDVDCEIIYERRR